MSFPPIFLFFTDQRWVLFLCFFHFFPSPSLFHLRFPFSCPPILPLNSPFPLFSAILFLSCHSSFIFSFPILCPLRPIPLYFPIPFPLSISFLSCPTYTPPSPSVRQCVQVTQVDRRKGRDRDGEGYNRLRQREWEESDREGNNNKEKITHKKEE